MLKRILSVLLCAALLLGGTALAAKEDDYTLPELLYQQFAVQDYPIRGSVAVTASGTASWLDFLLPLTASTLHVRLLNLEDSDDFQYQVFSQDDSGSQQGLTQLYRVGDTLYLRTDVLPDVLLSMPLAESGKSNPSFYSVLAEMMAQPDILWESMWQPALEEYLNELELWLADYAAEPDTMTENGELVMRVSYVIPADDVKEQTKLMWKQALYDETLLTLLRPMMTEEQQAAYLNPALGYFYDACIDALPLSGDLRLSRKFSARGDTLSVAVPRRKRNFFRRFADLFSPPKEDSSIVISHRERVVDSLPATAVKDTIAIVLRTLQDRVTSDRIGIYDRAWDEGMRLRYSNELVNTKIYRLIMDFEAEDTAFLLGKIDQTEAIRRRSSYVLGGIAAVAVVLMLLFVGILLRDINRSNRYRRALERANRDNEALLAAREKLMLAITHDIKAPLGSVMGYIDLLSRLTTGKREGLYLHNMKESSEHLLALVNSLLDFYRLDINKVDVDNVAFCPAQLFETIREGFAAMAQAKGIALVLEAGPGAGDEVMGDPFRIRQVADNLISNALKFTDEGSVTIRADVVEGRLVFSVRDTGRGIGREEKERIFQEFVRLRSAQGVDGFGLGLSIVDRLVKLLGGSISLESRLGEGSKFIVSVPVGRSSGKKPDGPQQPARTAARPDLKVLLIDDDPLQLEMTAGMCRQAGVAAECCQYPEYAAKLVAEGVFDAVFTDIQMPSADGFSVLAAVRGVDSAIPVVAVSARGEMDAGDFSARGFAGCLRKPFTANELVAVLNTVCGADDAVAPVGCGVAAAGAEQADGVDFSALTAYAGDDTAAARGILESFAEQGAANCALLERALDEGDTAALKAVAHKMTPIFTMLGAVQVAAALRTAESWEGPLTDTLCREVRTAAENIRAIIAEAQKKVSLS